MNVLNKHIVYFIGIGGIGMSALARWFNAKDHLVFGYDKTPTALTDQLIAEGIAVHFNEDLKAIPKDSSPENTLVVYTPAVPAAHAELDYFRMNGFTVEKRSAVLGSISNDYFTVAVAGTHGKTTTSSMIAHLLNHSGVDTTAFLGGIAVNYDSNLLIGKTDEAVAVVEADEFDRSFLQLSPNIEVITSIDPDHLDIYGSVDEMRNSFAAFIGNLKKDGTLLVSDKVNDELGLENSIVYGLNKSEVRAENIQASDKYTFDYLDDDGRVDDLVLNMPGYHNTENAVAAIKVAKLLGVSNEHIKSGLSSYLGVKRRFEYVIRDKVIYIDDYAHHPEEIAAFLTSLKSMYPDRQVKVIFQPHLFSRTRDFVKEFAESLDQADEVVLMDIYPARELPIEGITSRIIYDHMKNTNRAILSESEIIHDLTQNKPDVIATLGAGNIDKLVPKIKNVLTQYYTI